MLKPCEIPSTDEDGWVLSSNSPSPSDSIKIKGNLMITTDDLVAHLKAEKVRVAGEREFSLDLQEKLNLAYIEAKKELTLAMSDLTTAMKITAIPWELVWAKENAIVLRPTSLLTTSIERVGKLLKYDNLNDICGLFFKDSLGNEWTISTSIFKNRVELSPQSCLLQALKPIFSRIL